MAAVFDFKDDQGRPRKPTQDEALAIQQYLNDQHPLDTSIPVRRSSQMAQSDDLAAERGESTGESFTPKKSPAFDETQIFNTMNKSLEEILASQQRETGIRAAHAPELERRRADEEAEILRQEQNRPAVPTVPERPPMPTRQQSIDPTIGKSLFAVASLMAGLAMAGGRGRGMLAMAGLSGAMRGFNEGNQERYEAGLREYKLQVDEQTKAYDEQYKNYMAILNSNKLSLEEKMRMYDLEAARQQDELGMEAAKRKDISEMIKHSTEIYRMKGEMEKAAAAAEDLPSKRKHDEIMRASLERQAKLREETAIINRDKAREKAAGKAAEDKQVGDLTKAITREQNTLASLQKEEKAAHSIWDYFGSKNKALKTAQKNIADTRDRIAKLQGQLNQAALRKAVSDAVTSGMEGIEVGEGQALELPQ